MLNSPSSDKHGLLEIGGVGISMVIEKVCQDLLVFPLPRIVLMPGAMLPLHVFETRYRELIEACLQREKILAIATLRDGYEEDYYGSPDLHLCVGIGEIVAHQPFPDGRCNVALQYIGRATLTEELQEGTSYRQFKAAPIVDKRADAGEAFGQLRVLLLQLGMASPQAASEAQRLIVLDDMVMLNSLARKILDEIPAQLAFLASRDLSERVRMVFDAVASLLANVDAVGDA